MSLILDATRPRLNCFLNATTLASLHAPAGLRVSHWRSIQPPCTTDSRDPMSDTAPPLACYGAVNNIGVMDVADKRPKR